MMQIFVTGISTEVGKTIAASIITEALEADYWKPIQAGDLDTSDSQKIEALISNQKSRIHPNSYALKTPMSPHAAAEIDGIAIKIEAIIPPETNNHLVIEGAGGLLVPVNDSETIFDLLRPEYKVVVVSRHYLGSINHSLLTLGWLQKAGFEPVIIFNGDPHPTTENIILKKTGVKLIGRIRQESTFNKAVIKRYAEEFRNTLLPL
ncbi:MAG: dethiobiotin synthase [Eudoraea sp.]|nr:dethiobiotin synthase [Eudoraea sp.]